MVTINDDLGLVLYTRSRIRCADLQHEIDRFQSRVNAAKSELQIEQQLLVATSNNICMNCTGMGKLWISYDQDDTKLETCPRCTGTGLLSTGGR